MSGASLSQAIQFIAVAAIPILFAITLHEVAHGWTALQFGDRTAEMMGRLTINPLKHIDPIGTILVPVMLILTTGFMFGWAKPVPVNFSNLRNPKRDMVVVAAAGPASNFIMALAWAALARLLDTGQAPTSGGVGFFVVMAEIGVFFNLLLGIFNLLPIPPLDGGRVLRGLVPERFGHQLDRIEPFGLIIIVVLLVFGLIRPVIDYVYVLQSYLVGG